MSPPFKYLMKDSLQHSPQLFVVHLPQLPIFQQLLFEESLYRLSQNTSNSWLIINDYTQIRTPLQQSRGWNSHSTRGFIGGVQDRPSVVLGISGKVSKLVIKSSTENDKIELIRRYTVRH